MSLQERTLVLRNFDPEKTTRELITELFIQAGPVKNVVIRPDHAFVEFEDTESVAYSKALLDGVEMFGKKLELQPKARLHSQMKYVKLINDYIAYDRQTKAQQTMQQQQPQIALYQQQQQQQQQQRYPATQQYPIMSSGTMPTFTAPPVHQPGGLTYPVQVSPNPQLFNLNPFIQTAQFMPPNPWAQQPPPSYNSQSGPANRMQRSWSFDDKNAGRSGNSNRNNQLRHSDNRRR